MFHWMMTTLHSTNRGLCLKNRLIGLVVQIRYYFQMKQEMIEKAVNLLPEKERVVFILRDVNGLSTEKAGEILDLSIPAVKSRLHRARLFLRKKLSNYFDEYNGRGEKK